MRSESNTLLRLEFEARIFVSLSIVAAVCVLSYSCFSELPPLLLLGGQLFGLTRSTAYSTGYLALGFVLACVSVLRMWAGCLLTPQRVMAFRVQVDQLNTAGPYRIIRNPIYLADFIAMCAFSVCLPLPGLVLPALFYAHYVRIIRYEEYSLGKRYGSAYDEYSRRVPRLFPRLRCLPEVIRALHEFKLTREGALHNALYVLFIPGFVLAACTHEFWHAILLGLPGVIDWAVVHTTIGMRPRNANPAHESL